MIEVLRTARLNSWLLKLRDDEAMSRIMKRVDRVATGNLGDVASVGDGVSEMRIFYGPGYRIYFVRRGRALIVLLCGGDKSTQANDIRDAKQMAREIL